MGLGGREIAPNVHYCDLQLIVRERRQNSPKIHLSCRIRFWRFEPRFVVQRNAPLLYLCFVQSRIPDASENISLGVVSFTQSVVFKQPQKNLVHHILSSCLFAEDQPRK